MVIKSQLTNCRCTPECEAGEEVPHKFYLTWYLPYAIQIVDAMYIVFSNPAFSSRKDIMEHDGGLTKTVDEVDNEVLKRPLHVRMHVRKIKLTNNFSHRTSKME
jgi:hypothetical protein